MVETILVPASASDIDSTVSTFALTFARAFGAHLDFLHARLDTAALAAATISEDTTPATGRHLIYEFEEVVDQREPRAEQGFRDFCRREQSASRRTPRRDALAPKIAELALNSGNGARP